MRQSTNPASPTTFSTARYEKKIARLERKCWINHEISKELSRRNVLLKKCNESQHLQLEKIKRAILEIQSQIQSLRSEEGKLERVITELMQAADLGNDRVATLENISLTNTKLGKSKRQSIITNGPGTSLLRKSFNLQSDEKDISLQQSLPITLTSNEISANMKRNQNIPLFEHFLVVGASLEAANDVAGQFQNFEARTISSRFKKTIDGILSSPTFVGSLLQGSAANNVNVESKTASSYFTFNRNRAKSIDRGFNNAPFPIAESESDSCVEGSNLTQQIALANPNASSAMSVKTLFSSPTSLFTLKSRSKEDRKQVEKVSTSEQQQFEAFVDLVDKEEENVTISSQNVLNSESPVTTRLEDEDHQTILPEESLIVFDWNGARSEEGETDEVEVKFSPTNPVSRERSLSRLTDNTNRSIQNLTSGIMAGSNVIKSNAGTAWSKLGGAFLSKLNSVSAVQSPHTKSNPSMNGQSSSFPQTSDCGRDVLIQSHGNLNGESLSSVSKNEMESVRTPVFPSSQQVLPVEMKEAVPILSKDLKSGSFIIAPDVLFRFPENIDPPPIEVCDFCMPTGAKLQYLSTKEEDNAIQDILFGNTHNKRSGRSFVFLLEDKTIDNNGGNDKVDESIGRLYGVCVIHPRLLRTNVADQTKKGNTKRSKLGTGESVSVGSNGVDSFDTGLVEGGVSSKSSGGGLALERNIEFESSVCYAFITRFPYFDFFFQILYDIIALEKLKRIEMTNDLLDKNFEISKDLYEYLPSKLLLKTLKKLSSMNLEGLFVDPEFTMQLDESLKPISLIRNQLLMDSMKISDEESMFSLAQWCLPTVLSWVPTDLLVWCLSLLLLECKLIVIGQEAGLISSVVLGFLTLLKPFCWVAPVIPILPTKLLEFVESPVPILAGVLVDSLDTSRLSAAFLLKQCSESGDGITTAVFDVTRLELGICTGSGDSFHNLALPGALDLTSSLENVLKNSENEWNDFSFRNNGATSNGDLNSVISSIRPLYHSTQGQKDDAKVIQNLITKHFKELSAAAVDIYRKTSHDKKRLEAQLSRLSFSSQLSNFANQEDDLYFSDSDADEDHVSSHSSSHEGSRTESDNEEKNENKSSRPFLGGELRNFYEKMMQGESSLNFQLESSEKRKQEEERARALRKQLGTSSIYRLSSSNFSTNNQKEFLHRFLRTQLFEDFLHRHNIES